MSQRFTAAEEKALVLLGQGLSPEVVGSAVGLSASRISQLLSQDDFKDEVTKARFENLQAHSRRDGELDALEDTLIGKLSSNLGLLFKPMEIVRALQVVNAAKRRGQSGQQAISQQNVVVQLNLPLAIRNQFVVSSNNQVVKVGQEDSEEGMQELLTIQAGRLLKNLEEKNMERLKEGVRKLTTPPSVQLTLPQGSQDHERSIEHDSS